MRRTILLLAAVALLLAMVSTRAAAGPPGPDPVPPDLRMYDPDVNEITVGVGETVTLGVGWQACTPGLERMAIKASVFEWFIDGEPIEAAGARSRLFERSWDGPDPCLTGANDPGYLFASWWVYPFVFAAPRDYEVRMMWSFTHPVLDAADLDGDGRFDRWPAGTLFDETVTVHVV